MIGVRVVAMGLVTVGCALAVSQAQPAKEKPAPKLEPVAETKLLMEALAAPNFKGLGKLLKDKPVEAEAWTFARGQALVIAETGNLLMMRPQQNGKAAQEVWMARAVELRDRAAALARAAEAKDYVKARAGLADLANSCNHCHKAVQVNYRVKPFPEE